MKHYRMGEPIENIADAIAYILGGCCLFVNGKVKNAAFLQNLQLRYLATLVRTRRLHVAEKG